MWYTYKPISINIEMQMCRDRNKHILWLAVFTIKIFGRNCKIKAWITLQFCRPSVSSSLQGRDFVLPSRSWCMQDRVTCCPHVRCLPTYVLRNIPPLYSSITWGCSLLGGHYYDRGFCQHLLRWSTRMHAAWIARAERNRGAGLGADLPLLSTSLHHSFSLTE